MSEAFGIGVVTKKMVASVMAYVISSKFHLCDIIYHQKSDQVHGLLVHNSHVEKGLL